MFSRIKLSDTPSALISLALPCAAVVMLSVVAVAQRGDAATQTASLSSGQILENETERQFIDRNPSANTAKLAAMQDPGVAVPKDALSDYNSAHAIVLVQDLETKASQSADGITVVSAGELHVLKSALAAAGNTHSTVTAATTPAVN